MKNEKPLVSVGVPVFNEERYIMETLSSIKAQTYHPIEVIISDNHSTDGTWNIIQPFINSDDRFRAVRQSENTDGYNWIYVLEQAKGEYFIWIAGHDLWAPDMIESCVNEMMENPNIVLCAPQTKWIDMEGGAIESPLENINTSTASTPAGRALLMYKRMKRCNAIYGLFRRKFFLYALPFPKVVGNDFIILMRIASLGDVKTIQDTCWYRRKNREVETRDETVKRQINVIGIHGLAARYPYIVSRLIFMNEFLKFKGSLFDRTNLLLYAAWKLFFVPAQFNILFKEFLRGTFAYLRK